MPVSTHTSMYGMKTLTLSGMSAAPVGQRTGVAHALPGDMLRCGLGSSWCAAFLGDSFLPVTTSKYFAVGRWPGLKFCMPAEVPHTKPFTRQAPALYCQRGESANTQNSFPFGSGTPNPPSRPQESVGESSAATSAPEKLGAAALGAAVLASETVAGLEHNVSTAASNATNFAARHMSAPALDPSVHIRRRGRSSTRLVRALIEDGPGQRWCRRGDAFTPSFRFSSDP